MWRLRRSRSRGKPSIHHRSIRFEALEARQLLTSTVVISEFLASNSAGWRDGDGNTPDWIEVYNAGATAVDLHGYHLTDEADDRTKWTFPSVTLDPGRYMVVFASGQDTDDYVDAEGKLHTNFALGRSGEYLALVDPDGEVLSEYGDGGAEFPEQQTNVSYGVTQKAKLLEASSDVMYWVPLGADAESTWTQREFDAADAGFSEGKAAIGYEDRPDDRRNFSHEVQTSIRSRSHAVYVRLPFTLQDASAVRALKLRLKYDNGFIAYLNGTKVAEDNAPANPQWYSSAPSGGPSDSEALEFVDLDLGDHLAALVDGENILAIHGVNYLPDDSDMLLVPEVIAVIPGELDRTGFMPVPTPGEANGEVFAGVVADTSFSVDRGFFEVPQQVEIGTETQGAEIYYTVDGTDPSPSNPSAVRYAEPLLIDATTTLRAAAFKPEYLPTNVDTHTYVFVDDVIQQRDMRTSITSDPVWGPQLQESFTAIPTVSLVTPYRVTERQTISRETGTSVELIFPDGTEGFQIDAGLEHWGGHTLSNSYKKNMRLSFKSIYGPTKLSYDLFGEGATDEFDQLVLRTGSHDNWFWTHPTGNRGIYIRNKWANDRHLEMGHASPHGRYVHVYINGTYWGMHHLMERPNAAFMASYFGGDKEDYDALNAGTPVDGNSQAWNALQRAAGDYDELTQYLDVVNYADYMLLQFYGGNDWDWNHSQNWMAAREREEGAGWKYFHWDSDLVLRTTPTANVVNRGGPGNLWGSISRHEEFRIVLADRAQKFFFDEGMLTSERVLAQFEDLSNQIRLPLIAETARWTGSNNTAAYTPETWETHLDRIRTRNIPNRAEVVIQQMRRAGVFPDIDAPSYLVEGAPQHGGIVGRGNQLTMSTAEGTIYYTLDGGDPRLVGGGISPDAIQFDGPIQFDQTQTIKARALHDGEWSALSEATFQLKSEVGLRITELNFHPYDANSVPGRGELDAEPDAFEFIELANVSGTPLDLGGVQLAQVSVHGRDEGVFFQFAPQVLQPGEHVVVVKDRDAYQSRYGNEIRIASGNDGQGGGDGQYGGTLSDDGERITLLDSRGGIIHQFDHASGGEWPARAAGKGSSLEIIDPEGNYNAPNNWRSSREFGGSPAAEGIAGEPGIVVNEILASRGVAGDGMIELYNTTSQAINVGNWYLSNSDTDYFSFQIPTPDVIPGGGYRVLTDNDLGFELDRARGDEVRLIEADSSGHPVAFVDHIQFGATAEGISVGRWPNGTGDLLALSDATFGSPNADRWVGDVVITEIHLNPIDPDRDRPLKAEEFEFVELYNRSSRPIDVGGWRLSGGIEFTFDLGTTIAPEEALTVVPFDSDDIRKANVFRFYLEAPSSTRLVGPFDGDLADSGDVVRLEQSDIPPADDPDFTPYVLVEEIDFREQPPWPGSLSEAGESLNRTQSTVFGGSPTIWTMDVPTPGAVDLVDRVVGDSDDNGRFDQADIVLVLQAGKYGTGEPATWQQGDWNGDGRFDQDDIIRALQMDTYSVEEFPAIRTFDGAATGDLVVPDTEPLDDLFAQIDQEGSAVSILSGVSRV